MKPKNNASSSNSKKLHAGKKLEEQKPLKAQHTDFSITKVIDKPSS